MQAGVGLLVSDMMPTYLIISRYSHNYAQFCQLLHSSRFNLAVCSPCDRRGNEERIYIVATKDKTMGFIHIA